MAEEALFFYSCDHCRIKKQVGTDWRGADKARYSLLGEGWVFANVGLEYMSKDGTRTHSSTFISGSFCSSKCLARAVLKECARRVIKRRKGVK